MKTETAIEKWKQLRDWTARNDYYAAAVELMDDEIRERVHKELGFCEQKDFLQSYCTYHLQKFGKAFEVA